MALVILIASLGQILHNQATMTASESSPGFRFAPSGPSPPIESACGSILSSNARYNLGVALGNAGEYAEAFASIQALAEVEPDAPSWAFISLRRGTGPRFAPFSNT
ncbi:MAG: hypothetical protein ACREYF_08995 [Gammaproteobacteria bacterium]